MSDRHRQSVTLAAFVHGYGGVARHIIDLGAGLRDCDYDVAVEIPTDAADDLVERIGDAGLSIVPWGNNGGRAGLWHLHSANTYSIHEIKAVARTKLRHKRPVIITEHLPRSDASDVSLMPGRRTHGATTMKNLMKRAEFACADAIIGLSNGSRSFLQKRYRLSSEVVRLVPNGVPVPSADSVSEAHRGVKELRVLTVGAVIAQKGHETLVRAAAKAKQPWHVAVAGTGPHVEHLRELARELGVDRVEFLGWRSDIEVLMQSAHVVCLPSLWESAPYAALDAMAASRAVVASAVDGLEDMVKPDETGLLVPPAHPQALADALDDLATRIGATHDMGIAGRRRVQEQFGVDRMVEETSAVYQKVMSRGC